MMLSPSGPKVKKRRFLMIADTYAQMTALWYEFNDASGEQTENLSYSDDVGQAGNLAGNLQPIFSRPFATARKVRASSTQEQSDVLRAPGGALPGGRSHASITPRLHTRRRLQTRRLPGHQLLLPEVVPRLRPHPARRIRQDGDG